jgi:hypothetical protein
MLRLAHILTAARLLLLLSVIALQVWGIAEKDH